MTGLLIGVGILIVLIIGLCSYLGINIGSGFLSILGIAALIIIGFLLVIHYGGRLAQTMNPPYETRPYINLGPNGISHSYVPRYPNYLRDQDGSIIIPGPPGQEDKGYR